MLLRLLGLLPLCCFCSAMLLPEGTEDNWNTSGFGGPDNSSDPSSEWPGVSRSGALPFPPTGGPGISVIPPMSETAICDMLMNQPVPPPIDQIPFFCFCSRCKGTPGPKGDRGDRGPPGM